MWSRVGWWSCWESEAIGGQVADQGMGLKEAELDSIARGRDERPQVAQAKAGALERLGCGPFQGMDGMLFCEMKEPLEAANTVNTAVAVHGLGPGAASGPEPSAQAE